MNWRFVHLVPVVGTNDPSVLMVDEANDADAEAMALALYPGATVTVVNDDGQP